MSLYDIALRHDSWTIYDTNVTITITNDSGTVPTAAGLHYNRRLASLDSRTVFSAAGLHDSLSAFYSWPVCSLSTGWISPLSTAGLSHTAGLYRLDHDSWPVRSPSKQPVCNDSEQLVCLNNHSWTVPSSSFYGRSVHIPPEDVRLVRPP